MKQNHKLMSQEEKVRGKEHAIRSPKAAPSNPVLADILHTRRLRQQLVHLVADIQLLGGLEVAPRKFLLDPREHLQRPCVLRFSRFHRRARLHVQRSAFQDRRPSGSREIARLNASLQVDILGDRLPAIDGREGCAIRRFPRAESPVD